MASPEEGRLWRQDPQGRWTLSVLRAGLASQVWFSPDGRLLATASLDGREHLWALRQNFEPRAVASVLHQAPAQDGRFPARSTSLLTLSTAGLLHGWLVPPPLRPMGPTRLVSAMAFSPGGDGLVCGSRDSRPAGRCPGKGVTTATTLHGSRQRTLRQPP